MRRLATILLALGAAAPAADHRNLDAGVPLSVDDAYPIKFREPALQMFAPYRNFRGGVQQGEILAEAEYGLARDVQLNVGTRLFGRSRGRNEGSGDVDVDVLYNLNTETLRLPAFAVKAEAALPTGVDSRGGHYTVKGILTRSIGFHRVHLNLGHTIAADPEVGERRHRWQGIAGWDRPIGLQSLLVADVVIEESELRGNPVTGIIEVGLRRQITPRLVASFGAGFGLTGGSERQPFFIGGGISRSF